LAEKETAAPKPAAIRLCLDVNVWIAHLLAIRNNRVGGSASGLVRIVRDMTCTAGPVQLVISWEMLGTLEGVLSGLKFDSQSILANTAALVGIMKSGPLRFDPHLLPEGGRSLPMKDMEDAGVLASAIAARADLLIADNLDHLAIKDAERVATQTVRRRGGSRRQLYALILERSDGVSLVIAHPIDAIEWLDAGMRPTADAVRKRYAPAALQNL
jgi:predicted nucleic acid-binding protein